MNAKRNKTTDENGNAVDFRYGEGKARMTIRHPVTVVVIVLGLTAVGITGFVTGAMQFGHKPPEQGSSSD